VRLVLLGPPGTGKGSLASLCEERLGVPHVSTGQIFREEISRRSALGRRVQAYVASGRLVPDRLVVQVMTRRLSQRAFAGGFILDGFPRTRGQAAGLNVALRRARTPLDGAVVLQSPDALLVTRLSGRRVCGRCGANYHVRSMRPKRPGRCDRCGGALVTRADDAPRTIRQRLAVDGRAARPLLAYYRSRGLLRELDGRGNIEIVFRRAARLFRRESWLPA